MNINIHIHISVDIDIEVLPFLNNPYRWTYCRFVLRSRSTRIKTMTKIIKNMKMETHFLCDDDSTYHRIKYFFSNNSNAFSKIPPINLFCHVYFAYIFCLQFYSIICTSYFFISIYIVGRIVFRFFLPFKFETFHSRWGSEFSDLSN